MVTRTSREGGGGRARGILLYRRRQREESTSCARYFPNLLSAPVAIRGASTIDLLRSVGFHSHAVRFQSTTGTEVCLSVFSQSFCRLACAVRGACSSLTARESSSSSCASTAAASNLTWVSNTLRDPSGV